MKTIFTTKSLVIFGLSFTLWLQASLLNAQFTPQLSGINNSGTVLSNDTPPRLIWVNDKSFVPNGSGSVIPHKSATNVNSLSISIIESQSENVGHNMDLNWQAVATNMGHIATILPQTTLDNTDFFSTTDILIISSGVIDIPTNRRQIIQQWVEQGGPLYIQAEYLPSFPANQTFQEVVNNLGGVFVWGLSVSGELSPMNISGILSTTPNSIPFLTYFWYGTEGSGNETIEENMEFGGQYFGFIFTPPNPDFGIIISNSDQDWARDGAEKEIFMENILTYLSSTLTGVEEIKPFQSNLMQNSPNPFNGSTAISFSLDHAGKVKIAIHNILGNEIQILADDVMQAGKYTVNFSGADIPKGIYFCTMQIDNQMVATRKMQHVK
jgi:hypothetical protein